MEASFAVEEALEDEMPATAALISSTVASGTRRLSVKMHPKASLASSQVFPFPVGSPMVPGANVPELRASVALPPTDAICLANSRTMALLIDAALSEAGSYHTVSVSNQLRASTRT